VTTEAIYRYIEEHKGEHIAKIQEFLRQPSVSVENYGVRECAELLASYYRDLGCQEVELVPTDGHPGVWAYYQVGAPKTIVSYAVYDTPSVLGEVWTHPPFAAELAEMPPFRQVVIGVGAARSKGPYRAWLNVLESIIAVEGKLPVNVMFIAEGEEEVGSPHLPQIVHKYAERLKTADAVLNCEMYQEIDGAVRMDLGMKGMLYVELECSGRVWGRGPREFDIHSSMNAVTDSPVWRLIHALATMTSSDGNTILIEGFYDKVAPPSTEDMELIDELVKRFDDSPWKEMYKVDRWIDDAAGRDLLMKYFYSPTLNIDGIWGGYTGPGAKTVLPHKVIAKMDVRLVPDQESQDIVPLIRRHLDSHGYGDIEVRQLSACEWSKTSVKEPVVQAVLGVYRRYGVPVQVWPRTAGSVPFHVFTRDPLNLPIARGGLGHGGRAHSPDEYLVIEGNEKVAGLVEAEKSFVDILYACAEG
jgi:acetylornithine deacetylase/succinyl-diaminopimelate desuccinylase-like protein